MKKFISILLVCFLCLSMVTIVGAAETYGDLTIEYTKYDADSFNPNGYIKVDVYLNNLKGLELTNLPAAGGFGGYDAVGMELHYDADVFTPGYTSEIVPGTGVTQVTVGVNQSDWPLLTDASPFNAAGSYVTATPSPFAADGYIKYGTGHAGYVCAGTTGFDSTASNYYPALGKVRFATFYLAINDNAPATTDLWLENVEFAHATYGYTHNSFNLGTATVVIKENTTPEKSTVRTFPKLRWDETNKQLTTVGVITIGQDYDTIKYGINIEKGEGTVNYWANSAVKTTDETEAYYAVRLDNIDDETTDIKSTSAAKAILSNGAEGDAETKDSVIE